MRWSAGAKVVISTSVVVVLVLVLGLTASLITNSLGGQLDRAINELARQQMLAGKIAHGVSQMDALESGLALSTMLQQAANAERLRQEFPRQEAAVRGNLQELQSISTTQESQAQQQKLMEEFEAARRLHYEVVSHMEHQRMDTALALLNQSLLPKLAQMGKVAGHIVEEQADLLATVRQEAGRMRSLSSLVMLGLTVLSAIVGVAVLLTVRRIYAVVRQTVDELNENARHLAGAALQVSSSSQTVSHAASEQAASLEQTSASAEELHAMTQRNAENAESATRRTQEASLTILEANQALEQMVVSMNEINSSSNKISKIIKVIDDIAFQTNILALNAAVEAARAGDAGMGFAVVADEVRSLAQRSAQAARDTTQLIEESINRANEGKAKLDEVARAVASVTESAQKAKGLVEEVHVGSDQQTHGIRQIAHSVAQMEQVTQQLAATAEEGAASGHELSAQARRVDEIVAGLQQLVGGGPAVQPPERNVRGVRA